MRGMTRIMHQCGAAIQFMVWIALWTLLVLALV
jgi:hypothetical protein